MKEWSYHVQLHIEWPLWMQTMNDDDGDEFLQIQSTWFMVDSKICLKLSAIQTGPATHHMIIKDP